MGAIASQITILTIVYSIVYSDADQRKQQKLRVTGLCAVNSPGTDEFPAQMTSYAENVSIWWRPHGHEISNMAFPYVFPDRQQANVTIWSKDHLVPCHTSWAPFTNTG